MNVPESSLMSELLLKLANTRNPNIIPVENGSNSSKALADDTHACTATLDPSKAAERNLTNAQVRVTSHVEMDWIVTRVY